MPDKKEDLVYLNIRNVPSDILMKIDVLAAVAGTNRSEYLRQLMSNHVETNFARHSAALSMLKAQMNQ